MIDWGRVDKLREEVGRDDFSEVVDIFMEEVEELLTKLQQARDLRCLADDLHFLKGSALSLGFRKFATLCREYERQANAQGPDSVQLDPLFQCFTESKSEFLNNLPARMNAA